MKKNKKNKRRKWIMIKKWENHESKFSELNNNIHNKCVSSNNQSFNSIKNSIKESLRKSSFNINEQNIYFNQINFEDRVRS